MPRVASPVGGSKATKDAITSDLFGFFLHTHRPPTEERGKLKKQAARFEQHQWPAGGLPRPSEPCRDDDARAGCYAGGDPPVRARVATATLHGTPNGAVTNCSLRTCGATALALHTVLPF
jgi:hypothetical protein